MRRISSATTFWNKRVFPVLWFGILAVVACFMLAPIGKHQAPLAILIFPAFMALFGYVLMRLLVFPLADEVFLDEDEVIVRKNGQEVRFPVRQIINVDSSVMVNPERITLTLREPCNLGREVSFMPQFRFHFISRHPIAEELIARANGIEPSTTR